MNIKAELIKNEIIDAVTRNLDNICIDADKISDTTATKMIEEIQKVLVTYGANFNDKNSDFKIVEEIVNIFEKYGISAGACHDFG